MPELKQFPKMYVAYVQETGPYNEAMPRGFQRLFDWLGANKVQPLGASLCIFYDDPTKVLPETLRSEQCVPVAAEVVGTGPVQTKKIGGMEVATLSYQGAENMQAAYNELYDWLHGFGYQESGAPLETYLSQLGEALRAEIAVPVAEIEFLPASPKENKKKRSAQATQPRTKRRTL